MVTKQLNKKRNSWSERIYYFLAFWSDSKVCSWSGYDEQHIFRKALYESGTYMKCYMMNANI